MLQSSGCSLRDWSQGGAYIHNLDEWPDCVSITGNQLGKTEISRLHFENPDGSLVRINKDFFGKKRNKAKALPGPFNSIGQDSITIRLWR